MELEIRNATLGYSGKAVLTDVNLTLSTGTTTCFLGKNGAGKTTLFRSLLGLVPLLGGDVLLDGRSIRRWGRRDYARVVAYVPQARALAFPFPVRDVVLFGRTAHLSTFAYPRRKDRLIADDCLERLHISHLSDRLFTRLSGGEQQMVIVARALAQQPTFLIMDEPTASLDFGNQVKIIAQVNALKDESLGILMATHEPDHAFMCRANVLVAHNGKLWKSGDCDSVITDAMLKEIYDVNVCVCRMKDVNNRIIRTCLPVI
ncbi:MAG: ABC transporter ATP-binding protein [Bacteroidales bacterium]|jgi:iron complex transport system ATP-binding protein|nr:ABC transporter ATP-binding protein [Bacteroidales bacterium]